MKEVKYFNINSKLVSALLMLFWMTFGFVIVIYGMAVVIITAKTQDTIADVQLMLIDELWWVAAVLVGVMAQLRVTVKDLRS